VPFPRQLAPRPTLLANLRIVRSPGSHKEMQSAMVVSSRCLHGTGRLAYEHSHYDRLRCSSCYFLSVFLVLIFVLPSSAQMPPSTAKTAGTQAALTARGKYLVDGVARCGQCHTPRNSAGIEDPRHALEGAPLWLNPAQPMQDWPLRAPRIAGNPSATDDELVRLLTTGIWKDGTRLRAPMPQFRMSAEDAKAVAAYLRSLSPAQ
jgi:mono/diheme cytochrome c family protein